jgi:hypothetical protein
MRKVVDMDTKDVRASIIDILDMAAKACEYLEAMKEKESFLESISAFRRAMTDEETADTVVHSMAWALNIGYLVGAYESDPPVVIVNYEMLDDDEEPEKDDEQVH